MMIVVFGDAVRKVDYPHRRAGGVSVGWPIVTNGRARVIVDAVEQHLWTPLGLRSLARIETGYVANYEGNGARRDAAYHQGTVWPWLAGAFVDAWLRVRGYTEEARTTAARRFVAPLEEHLESAGLCHVSEIADADPPFTPRGCPFHAWSLGELIRATTLTKIVTRPVAGATSTVEESIPELRHTRAPVPVLSGTSDG